MIRSWACSSVSSRPVASGRSARRCDLTLLSNLYLNEVDRMLERAKEVTRNGRYTYIEYARYADDLVILVDGYRRWNWLEDAAWRRLVEELAKLDVQLNQDKTRRLDLSQGGHSASRL
nr:reverse transcriptase domain-containing protein [Thiocapsa sp.]